MSARSVPTSGPGPAPPEILDLDPEEAARRKAQRRAHLNVVQIPALRLFGLGMVTAFIALHNAWFLPPGGQGRALAFGVTAAAYGVLSWAILVLFFRRCPLDLGIAFLSADIVLLTYGTYCSGGEASWLFFLPLVRIADQTSTTYRRVMVFAHLGALCFAAMTLSLAFVEGRPLDWPREAVKVMVLYGIGLYMSLTARTAERLRARTTQAIHIARDLIQRLRETSRDLQDSSLRAEAASRTKSEFLATISHEIRTPLNAVIGMTDLLLDTPISEEQREYAEAVRRAGETLLTLIDGVLDFSRLEAGRLVLDDQPFALRRVVEEAVGRVAERGGSPDVVLRGRVRSEVPDALRGDAARLRQVLLNLVGNAMKFTVRGEVTVDVVLVSDDARGVGLRFTVRDTGIGIVPEARDRLFQLFTQADGSPTRRFGGAGLGLAISKRLVELMGGEIGFESVVGAGSTFWFTAAFTRGEPRPETPSPAPPALAALSVPEESA